jgi:OOP family OmpA-OmpF porin
VELRDNKIEIREKIQFEYNKAVILPVSFDLLAEIAKVIKENPHIKKLQIEGHASSEGNDAYNLKLSDQRAKAVMEHLVTKGGIPKEVLAAKGFGETKPIATNDTDEGKEKNRRVEFNVVEQDITKKKVEIDPVTGKEKVVGESKETIKKEEAAEPAPDPKKDGKADKKDAKADAKAEKAEAKAEKKDAKADAKAEKASDKAEGKKPETSAAPMAPKPAEKKAAPSAPAGDLK